MRTNEQHNERGEIGTYAPGIMLFAIFSGTLFTIAQFDYHCLQFLSFQPLSLQVSHGCLCFLIACFALDSHNLILMLVSRGSHFFSQAILLYLHSLLALVRAASDRSLKVSEP